MEILFFVFSCLLMLTNHLHQFCSEAATSNLEYPYPFMTADAKKAAARTYDYIVVGGGAAGCPLAATLSQKYSVLLLERGDSPYGNPDVEEFEKLYSLFGNATDFPYVAEAFYSEDGVQLARGRVLGGGTAINGGFYSRARSEDIREMKWDEKLVNESYEWVEKSIIFKQYKLFPWNSAFKNGLLEVGVLPYHGYTLDHLEGTKISGSIFDKNGKRHTAADLLQHANPENIVVLLNATASRILFNSVSGKLKASGVEFNNNDGALPYQVSLNQLSTNSEVILSAGSIGSPQLLLLSGIGPKEQLKKLNITVLLDLPLVGKNVQDNPSTGFLLESPKPLEFAYSQVVGILDDSQVYMEGGSYIQRNITSIQHLGLVRGKVAFPISRGDLWLKSIDPQDNPYVRYNYYSHPFDLKKCMFCVKIMINLSMSSPIQQFAFTNNKHMKTLQYIGTSLPNNPLNNSALAKYCNDTLDTYNHYHGGCQVGLVVDRRYQVKGVDNLRVVDGSIFKDSLGTNPQATILMLGRYMGIQILQERTKP